MRKVLYSEYHRTCAPGFQTETKIVEIDHAKWIEKKALTEEAKEHIAAYKNKYEMNRRLYSTLVPLEGNDSGDTVAFPYIEGESMYSLLNSESDKAAELCEKIRYYLELLLDFNEDMFCEFENTEEFTKVFGTELGFACKAVKMADVGLDFKHVRQCEKQWIVVDYDWTFDFPVPLEYMKYHVLHKYYQDNIYLQNEMLISDFMAEFDVQKAHLPVYSKMEKGFEQYILGNQSKYHYLKRYEKAFYDTEPFLEQCENQQGNIVTKQEKEELERQCRILAQQKAEIEKQRDEIASVNQRILASPFWKISKPVRSLLDMRSSARRKKEK